MSEQDVKCPICHNQLDDAKHCNVEVAWTSNSGDGNASVETWRVEVCDNCFDYLKNQHIIVPVLRFGMQEMRRRDQVTRKTIRLAEIAHTSS